MIRKSNYREVRKLVNCVHGIDLIRLLACIVLYDAQAIDPQIFVAKICGQPDGVSQQRWEISICAQETLGLLKHRYLALF
jgi:hypothetical protein